MTAETPTQGGNVIRVSQSFTVRESQEPAVMIGERHYLRLIERLEGCKKTGWTDLWLAGVGAGVALGAAAGVGAWTLPAVPAATRDILWVLTALGAVAAILCLVAYFTQCRDNGKEITELQKDLEMYAPQ